MKNLSLITLLLIGLSFKNFAQSDAPSYGPVPYRTLEQTIGDTYIVLPLVDIVAKNGYYFLRKMATPDIPLTKDYEGKRLKLISIDTQHNGHFTDSLGVEYICKYQNYAYLNIAPLSDIENSRKILLNKTLWMNLDFIATGDFKGNRGEDIKVERFDPVTVIDVVVGTSNTFPEILVVKTTKGEVGQISVNASGTNTTLDPQNLFASDLFTEDPKIKYHFTPEMWKMVKAGYVQVGMNRDAVFLLDGAPKTINTTTTGTTRTEQWVYGDGTVTRNLYFTNGKLTTVQN